MPRPVFILCANDFVEDKTTNLLSVHTIIEQIQGFRVEPGANPPRVEDEAGRRAIPVQFQRAKAMAVWMKEPGDDDREFETEFIVDFGGERLAAPLGVFRFEGNASFHRMTLRLHGFPLPEQSCTGHIIARIRAVGGDDDAWISQDYPILIEMIEQPVQEQAAPA